MRRTPLRHCRPAGLALLWSCGTPTREAAAGDEAAGQPVSEQRGKFVTEWVRQPDGTWLIERFFRVPVSTALSAGSP